MFLEVKDYAYGKIDVTASVFDEMNLRFLINQTPKFIKFAYSQKLQRPWIQECLENEIEAIVSCDVMTDMKVPQRCTKLFCVSQYPVYSQLSFDGLFPRFQGFSDHTMGINQTIEAVLQGARTIEKHFTLNHSDIDCPDSFFALSPAELASLVANIKRIEISEGEV